MKFVCDWFRSIFVELNDDDDDTTDDELVLLLLLLLIEFKVKILIPVGEFIFEYEDDEIGCIVENKFVCNSFWSCSNDECKFLWVS